MRGRPKRRITFSLMSLAVWIFVAPATSAAAQGADQAQVDKGRTAAGQICATCHNNFGRMIQTHRKTAEQWKDTVYSMIGRGALILPDEIDPLAAFLAATAGPNSRPIASPARTSPQAPESEGKALLDRNCQMCHDLATATKKPPAEEWRAVINKMVTYGASLTASEQQKLVEYLNGLTK
jgi:cytochrome c5